jgi:hypothetical protein
VQVAFVACHSPRHTFTISSSPSSSPHSSSSITTSTAASLFATSTFIINSAAFVCIGSLCLPPSDSAHAPLPLPPESRERGQPGPKNDLVVSYSYSFAVYAAFDDLAAGDDYRRCLHPSHSHTPAAACLHQHTPAAACLHQHTHQQQPACINTHQQQPACINTILHFESQLNIAIVLHQSVQNKSESKSISDNISRCVAASMLQALCRVKCTSSIKQVALACHM